MPGDDVEKILAVQEAVEDRIRNDEKFFIESCLNIVNKKSKLVPYIFNSSQSYIENFRKRFNIILKSRKVGSTSRFIARAIWRAAFQKNQFIVLISYDKESTQKLLDHRVKPMIENCSIDLGARIGADTVYFPEENSRIYIGTAGARKFGRGDDITFYQLTEAAFYKDENIITSIEEACTDDAEGVIESTGNGMNFFHRLWRKAVLGESKYTPIFVPWFFDSDLKISGVEITSLEPHERELVEAFNLSMEQIAWRRRKLKDMARPELFNQEFPETAEAAFIGSGKMFFNWMSLGKHEKMTEIEKHRGFLRDVGEGKIAFEPVSTGSLRIWEMPDFGKQYVIGADVAEGIEGGDFSAACVLDVDGMKQVAEWHGKCPPDTFGEILFDLGRFYNWAMLAPEAFPGVGRVTLERLLQMNYSNIFKRRDKKIRHMGDDSYGWETTISTKPKMMYRLAGDGIRDYGLNILSRELVMELKGCIHDGDGGVDVPKGCYMDRVIALAIAYEVANTEFGRLSPVRKFWEVVFGHQPNFDFMGKPMYHGPIYGRREPEVH